MRPITVRFLADNVIDTYLYNGHLFIAKYDGNIHHFDINQIYSQFVDKYPQFENVFKIVFLHNEWLYNDQFQATIHGEVLEAFERYWEIASNNIFELQLEFNEQNLLHKSSGYPIYDLRAYAYNLMIGHSKGMDVVQFTMDRKTNALRKTQKGQKVFDAKVINISAKSGNVLVSTGKEGLFSGSLWNEAKQLKLFEDKIEPVSFKTLWLGWNVNNYTSSSEFTFLENSTEKEPERAYIYSANDDDNQKIRIAQYGTKRIQSDILLQNEEDDVDFVTNSNSTFFLIYKSGKILTRKFMIDKETHLSHREKILHESAHIGKIIDARVAYEAVVLETMKSLYLLQDNGLQKLCNKQPYSFRSFLASKRYRKSIMASYDNFTDLYTLASSGQQ